MEAQVLLPREYNELVAASENKRRVHRVRLGYRSPGAICGASGGQRRFEGLKGRISGHEGVVGSMGLSRCAYLIMSAYA
jgi:hypothetical protein